MVTAITQGVKISVNTVYQKEYSNPAKQHFMFAYRIVIENLSDYAVQLLRRKWIIFDSNGNVKEVEGRGVVGRQPIIPPAEKYIYLSGCNLKTDIGSMRGHYVMRRMFDDVDFIANIPEFKLIVPFKLN